MMEGSRSSLPSLRARAYYKHRRHLYANPRSTSMTRSTISPFQIEDWSVPNLERLRSKFIRHGYFNYLSAPGGSRSAYTLIIQPAERRMSAPPITYKQPFFNSTPRVIPLANITSPHTNYAFLLPCHYFHFNSICVC
ncbi:hypothetical protein K503DRAFT_71098 [Rhizopogon vinicolor AM-OR11-026]|uniref:Uncharacterized protein n=1 Tax=Rhizopogon vinicolor AM-OR11-026 TaxID=1314800 RepID=A0A1B7N472_9AGAM|nr:hypothetical protein K503DRAFT_71098 [Rhizopogon vinicolor AM-OR11-026]